jgi:hypothetical protein
MSPSAPHFQTPWSYVLHYTWTTKFHTHKKLTGKITVLNISIFIFNKIYLLNNNLLYNDTSGRLSSWQPKPKHFSPHGILTSLSSIYKTIVYTADHHYKTPPTWLQFR